MFTSRLTRARSELRLFIWKLRRLSVMYLTFSLATSWSNLDWVLLIFDIRRNKDWVGRELSLLKTELAVQWMTGPAGRPWGILIQDCSHISDLRSSIASGIWDINKKERVLLNWNNWSYLPTMPHII